MVRQRISNFVSQGFQAVVDLIPWFSDAEQGRIKHAFSDIGSEAQQVTCLMIYQALVRLMRRRRNAFGMLVVCNWHREWIQEYASFPDESQNLFKEREYVIADHTVDELVDVLAKTADFDGAILVSRRGTIVASGVYLENMKAKEVARQMGVRGTADLSEAFGFMRKVHMRHLAGVACSYLLPDTVVFVVSEERKDLRILKTGTIIYSTYAQEIPKQTS